MNMTGAGAEAGSETGDGSWGLGLGLGSGLLDKNKLDGDRGWVKAWDRGRGWGRGCRMNMNITGAS